MRVSEFIDYINREIIPTPEELSFRFSHIKIDDELKKIRADYRKNLKKTEKELSLFDAI